MQLINKYILNFIFIILFLIIQLSCRKFVEVPAPATSTNSANVYTSDATAIASVTSLYTSMSAAQLPAGGISSISFFGGLSADEFTLYTGATNDAVNFFYTNSLSNTHLNGPDFWTADYQELFVANSALEGLSTSNGLTPAIKQQLTGEAEFMRAFCYFYLVNLYGDVPLILTSDYKTNSTVSRTPQTQVWQQIITDLKDAQNLLNVNYVDATLLSTTSERIRPTKWAAAALLARTYLYTGDWADAVSEADSVIGNSAYSLDSLNIAFLANSTEAIWQLQPVVLGQNTPDAVLFIIPSTGPSPVWPVWLSNALLQSFEPGDKRRLSWVDSVTVGPDTYYYPYKYKNDTLNSAVDEYEMVLRLGEQYLIRAEAEAQLNNLGSAAADLNMIRSRAGLSNISVSIANSQTSLLSAIYHERQVELFTEWGHRWLDLKRTDLVNAVMGTSGACAAKGGIWNTDWQWYPIALSQLQADPNLVQNTGY